MLDICFKSTLQKLSTSLYISAFSVFLVCGMMSFSSQATAQDENNFAIVGEDDTTTDSATLPDELSAEETAVQAEKFAVAQKIIKLNPVEGDLSRTIDKIAENIPANRRILFKSIINRSIKIDRLNAAAQLAFADLFTLEELKAMHTFYASETGRSVQTKMPLFKERLDPVIKAMVEDALFNVKNSNVDFTK